MATNQDKSLFELTRDLGDLLAERRRLIEESLPPQLRKGYIDPLPERCEAEIAFDYSPTGEDAYPCNGEVLCGDCAFCIVHCICRAVC